MSDLEKEKVFAALRVPDNLNFNDGKETLYQTVDKFAEQFRLPVLNNGTSLKIGAARIITHLKSKLEDLDKGDDPDDKHSISDTFTPMLYRIEKAEQGKEWVEFYYAVDHLILKEFESKTADRLRIIRENEGLPVMVDGEELDTEQETPSATTVTTTIAGYTNDAPDLGNNRS
jgi:hypothetical protein